MIRTERLTKRYVMGETIVTALEDVSLAIGEGEACAIVGRSGSGKSTLLNLLGTIDRPTSGRILLNGEDLSSKLPRDLARLRNGVVGFIFQAFELLPRLTALENVEFPLAIAGLPRRERSDRAAAALESVGLAHRLRHRPTEMSGGEQQRVAIARAMVNNPSLILADEPTGNLDSRTADEVMDRIGRLNREQGKTVILVTHDRALAERHCRRIVSLTDGRVVNDETV